MVLTLQTVNRVDAIVAAAQASGRAPSVVAGVVRDGTVMHVAGAGNAGATNAGDADRRSASQPPQRDLQYRIGSITKSFTAALVLMLRDEGRLDLDDPIGAHLPVEGVGGVRLRQLLGHAGGVQREPEGEWWERTAGVPLDELLRGVTADKLAFAPYRRFHYSNLAYGLLGGVVERVAGRSWWEVVSQRLLEPLGMRRTTYQAQEPFARGYVVHPWYDTLREEPRHDTGAMAPAGQLWSTVDDLSRWAAFLAEPGRTDGPLRPDSVAEMATPVIISDPETWTEGYGLGLQLWRRGERVYIGHTGSMPGYLAVLAVHRPSRTGVVAFANAYSLAGSTIGELGLSILDAVVEGEPAPRPKPWRPGAPPPPDVEPLCGRWWWMGREFLVRWDDATAALMVSGTRPGVPPSRFTRRDDDEWVGRTGEHAGEVLRVRRAADGTVTALDISTYVLTRDPLPPD